MSSTSLKGRHLAQLHALAAELEIDDFRKLTRDELVGAIDERDPDADAFERAGVDLDSGGGKRSASNGSSEGGEDRPPIEGVLEITSRGHGFIRPEGDSSSDDVYVSPSQIRRCELQDGDRVKGPVRGPRGSERHPALVHVDEVNGSEPGSGRRSFDELTPVEPSRRIALDGSGAEDENAALLLRAVDLLAPLARGQRVLVDAAVSAGRTTLLRALCRTFEGTEDLDLFVVLVDERPEEETAWRRLLGDDAELTVAGADMRARKQLAAVERALAAAQRKVLEGRDVVLVIDSLSRLGVAADDPSRAKAIFAAGRETEEEDAGSLTLIATTIDRDEERGVHTLVTTTESACVRLDPQLAADGVWPALEVGGCRTVAEASLRSEAELAGARKLRAELAGLSAREAADRLRERVGSAATNDSLLASLAD